MLVDEMLKPIEKRNHTVNLDLFLYIITKPSNVQHSNKVGGGLEGEALVHSLDHVIEEAAVHSLGQGIAGIVCLLHL